LPITVTVRNTLEVTVQRVSVACCADVASATFGPAGAHEQSSPDPGWDGDLRSLARWITVSNEAPIVEQVQPLDVTGRRDFGCDAMLRPDPFGPSVVVSMSGSAEVRVPPGDVPGDGHYVVRAVFRWAPTTADAPRSVVAELPVEVIDTVRARDDAVTNRAVRRRDRVRPRRCTDRAGHRLRHRSPRGRPTDRRRRGNRPPGERLAFMNIGALARMVVDREPRRANAAARAVAHVTPKS